MRTKWEEVRLKRDLGGNCRAGSFSRRKGLEHLLDFCGQYWLFLILVPILFVTAFLPLLAELRGVTRGTVLGAAVASGLWFDVLIAAVWSGAASKFMGAYGESSTAEVLRKLDQDGWRLVNGLRLNGRSDIDHIALGPNGAVVVESKWSASSWPLNGYGPRFMDGQLKSAAQRAQENAKALGDWIGESIPITPVAVFWTGAKRSGRGWQLWRDKRTVLIHGPDLHRWLRDELPRSEVDPDFIEQVWLRLSQMIEQQDVADAIAGDTMPLTYWGLIVEWALKPMIGLLVAAYALWLTHFLGGWLAPLIVSLALIGLGYFAFRFARVKAIAIGWIASSMACLIFVLVDVVRFGQ